MKQNCWDYLKCDRQPGGSKVSEFGVCPASTDSTSTGSNSGQMAGRMCWATAGTICGGKIQGTAAEKNMSCLSCDFYQKVKGEEGANFKFMK